MIFAQGCPLTEVQRQVLDFLLEYQDQNGYSPTHREIGERFGWSSYGTVHQHLRKLADKGWIRRERSQKRGLQVVDPAEESLLVDCRRLLERVVREVRRLRTFDPGQRTTATSRLADVEVDASLLLDRLADHGGDHAFAERSR